MSAETPADLRREFPARPVVGIGVVVWRGDKVLLIRRGKPPRAGQWSLPGGAQELGETVAEAAAREVFEETGVRIAAPKLVEVVDSLERAEDGRIRFHYTLVDVTAEWQSGEARAGSDAAEAAWVAPQALVDYELWQETRRIIALAAGRRGD